ncbi:acyltransferase [Olleya sp. Hel_I_94]|uniref:acyltransferase n=1 Tax=Olleya sp. Hel_I_94 TaxID=1250001 RepID=UPI00119D2C85|nr:hypothetical protein [Olleya sp. Hel_I_94]TVZ47790.1 transferase family hexapeptide repeat protein [Olleya sp. Hel_I_94]
MRSLINYIITLIIKVLPETRLFKFKNRLYQIYGLQLKENIKICSSARFLGVGNISIGSDTWIGPEVLMVSTSNISIGENVDIAPRVYIAAGAVVNKDVPENTMVGGVPAKVIKILKDNV